MNQSSTGTEIKPEKLLEETWYIIVNQQTKGPISLRDLDVLLRTNEINSYTYAWKNGMNEWKLMNQIQQIKDSILESSKQIFEIEKRRENLISGGIDQSNEDNKKKQDKSSTSDQNKKEITKKGGNGIIIDPVNKQSQQQNGGQSIPGEEKSKNDNTQSKGDQQQQLDDVIENKDEDVMDILEGAVGNLLQETFQQTSDGKWKIYDEEKAEWTYQDEEPTEKMALMKNKLLNKLKSELFSQQQKSTFKRKPVNNNQNESGAPNEEERPLTKEQLQKKERNRRKAKRAAEKKKEKWYQAKVNTFVYISGLPLDITEEEVKEFCSKAGVIRIDLNTGKQKVKLYRDENGLPKGDAAVSYAREESVEIALQMLNNSEIRNGFTVGVEKANFTQKDQNYVPRESKKESKVQKIQAKKREQKLFGWVRLYQYGFQNEQTEENGGQGLKIVIVKYVFDPKEQNDSVIDETKKQITALISEIGQAQRIRFYETHPEGVMEVKFKKDRDAENCIEIMNRKMFRSRELQSEYWDGETDYKHNALSLELQSERLSKFAQEIERK